MDWETMYTNVLIIALPGVSFPADYDFAAKHENDIARVRTQVQVDATIERDQLRERLAEAGGRDAARLRMLNAGVSIADIELLGS